MGIEERRNIEKTQMKKRIMDATIQIINAEGYENLSIRKIANRIEYSPTTVYLYYKDKAQIIEEMANELYQKIEKDAILVAEMYKDLPADARLEKILLAFVHSLVSEPEVSKSIMLGGTKNVFSSDKEGEAPDNPGISMLENLLTQGVEEGVFSPDVLGTSWMIVSALLGFVLCAIENHLYDLDQFSQYADRFVGLLIGGIVGNHYSICK